MNQEILVALLGLMGTCIGTFAGILTANKLTAYRIDQLEKKVDKHNTLIERTFVLETQMKSATQRIDALAEEVKDVEREIHEAD